MQGLTFNEVLYDFVKQHCVREAKMSYAQIADFIGLGEKNLYNKVNPKEEKFQLTAVETIRLTNLVEHYDLIEYMCAATGMVALHLPDLPKNAGEISGLVAQNVTEFGRLLEVIGKALADGKVSADELKLIEAEVHQQVRLAMSLLESAKKVAA